MYNLHSDIVKFNLKGQRVFLRVDLNVPLTNGTITNDYRLIAIKPTVNKLLAQGAKIILATHIGRPQEPDPSLSTSHLVPWFEQHGYSISFEPNLDAAYRASKESNNTIILLENLRFFPGESDFAYPGPQARQATTDREKNKKNFAQQLARLADYYVNDAFALVHRNDTSITLVPELFPINRRTIGLLIEKELSALQKLIDHPKRPFVLITGGGKVHDKLPLLYNMSNNIQTLLLCPAIVFTFAQALGKKVGKSLVDTSAIGQAQQFLEHCKKRNINVIFPIDYQIAQDSFTGTLSYTQSDEIPDNSVGITIGPKTVELFKKYILSAQTIFFNGLPGDDERPETLAGVQGILQAMTSSSAYTVIGGGDTVGIVESLGLGDKIDYLSTGGGATLAYLSGADLPGLDWAISTHASI